MPDPIDLRNNVISTLVDWKRLEINAEEAVEIIAKILLPTGYIDHTKLAILISAAFGIPKESLYGPIRNGSSRPWREVAVIHIYRACVFEETMSVKKTAEILGITGPSVSVSLQRHADYMKTYKSYAQLYDALIFIHTSNIDLSHENPRIGY